MQVTIDTRQDTLEGASGLSRWLSRARVSP